jgi:GcrA cell cycle regulator
MTFWTMERVDELKTRWANNETYSEICRAMGAKSRNAVIGKAHRLKLFRLAAAMPKRRTAKRANAGNLVLRLRGIVKMTEIPAPPVFDNPKLLLALRDGDCRWPGTGAGAAMLYCAAPAVDGKAYCLAHCRIAYVKPGSIPRARQ